MNQNDPFAQFKNVQREGWTLFTPVETLTTPAAAKLVHYAQIQPNQRVLDVGCGTGVVSITAARKGARVKGLDLTPALLERAKWNAGLAQTEIEFTEGDAEALPYKDAEFDVVVSQFGHMFAPRPDVAIAEMIRVLKPGGTLAFSTWPPELFTGRMFVLTSRYMPPPEGVAPPPLWGDPKVIRERLGERVKNLAFEREMLSTPALSPQHFRNFMETTVGPLVKMQQNLKDDQAKLKKFRLEFEELIAEFFDQNTIRQHYIMTRATKV
jgi:ubiquinone/menaquinone biosynthesis C-methylase UbiE